MVSFRREKKKRRMEENKVSEEARAEASAPTSKEEIRVTDRRRINLDGEASAEAAGEERRAETLEQRRRAIAAADVPAQLRARRAEQIRDGAVARVGVRRAVEVEA